MMRATSIRQILGKVDEELLLEPFGVAVQVSHGRSKVNVPHLLLNRQDASPAVHEVRGEAVTDQVRVDTLLNSRSLSVAATQPYVTAQSNAAVTFTFPSLTGDLFYHCDGN